jgi:hypothetical protein
MVVASMLHRDRILHAAHAVGQAVKPHFSAQINSVQATLSLEPQGVTLMHGQRITFTLNVTNAGSGALNNLTLQSNDYACFTFLNAAATTSQGVVIYPSETTPTMTVNIGMLPVGHSAIATHAAVVSGGCGTLSNRFLARWSGTFPTNQLHSNQITAPTAPLPDLHIQARGDTSDEAAALGSTVVVSIEHRRSPAAVSPQPVLTGIVISAVVPPHSTFDPAANVSGWQCAQGFMPGSVCAYAVDSATPPIVPFAFRLNSDIPVDVSHISTTVALTDDGRAGPDANADDNVAVTSVWLRSLPLHAATAVLLSEDNANALLDVDEVATFVTTLTNTSSYTLPFVRIDITMPDHFDYVRGSGVITTSARIQSATGSTEIPQNMLRAMISSPIAPSAVMTLSYRARLISRISITRATVAPSGYAYDSYGTRLITLPVMTLPLPSDPSTPPSTPNGPTPTPSTPVSTPTPTPNPNQPTPGDPVGEHKQHLPLIRQ